MPRLARILFALALTLWLTPRLAWSRGCLAAGTPIATPAGPTPVQHLRVGDAIWGVAGGRLEPARVMACYQTVARRILEIHVGGRLLRVTPPHPFQIAPGVFVEAGALRPGQLLWVWDDGSLKAQPIERIDSRETDEPVFNLLVSPTGVYLADGVVVHNKGCFLPDTPILMSDGAEVPIRDIRPGNRVKAFDPEDGSIVNAAVEKIITYQVNHYCRLTTSARVLNVTPEHPFYVGDQTFKTVEAMKPGDRIFVFDGHALSPRRIISIQTINRPATVYNLQTDEPHTFFAHGIAVHNKGGHGGFGGGHYGGGFGGGYHSSGWHSYGHGGAYGWSWSDWIFFAGILGFVIWIAIVGNSNSSRSTSGSRGSDSGDLEFLNPRSAIAAKAARTERLLQTLAASDPAVEPAALKSLVGSVFVQLEQCWANRNYAPMQPLLLAELYHTHCAQLAAMLRQHEINHIDNLQMQQIAVVQVRYTARPDQREFTAMISARARDYFTDDRTGSFIRGDSTVRPFQEFWIFHFWQNRWLLREIEQSRESSALREPNVAETLSAQQQSDLADAAGDTAAESPRESRLDASIRQLAEQDPRMWDRTAMTSRARDVFAAVVLAQEAQDQSQLKPDFLETQVRQELADRIASEKAGGQRTEYRNLCVRKVELVMVRGAVVPTHSEFTARVWAHAQTIRYRGSDVIYSDAYERAMSQFLVFAWSDNAWKLRRILAPAGGMAQSAST